MSPDLNPMDYAIWPGLRELGYFQQIEPFTEEELVEQICESWNEIEIELIQNSSSSWKKRLRDVIKIRWTFHGTPSDVVVSSKCT